MLFAYWGPNPLSVHRRVPGTIHEHLTGTGRPFVALVDASLPEKAEELAGFRVVYLESPGYEMSPRQLEAIDGYVARGGCLVLADARLTINDRPAAERFGLSDDQPVCTHNRGKAVLWNRRKPFTPTTPLTPAGKLTGQLRFAMYRKGDRLVVHVVNYNVCLLDKAKKVLDVDDVSLRVPLPDNLFGAGSEKTIGATCFDPDAEPQSVPCRVVDGAAQLKLPKTHIYKIVLLEEK